MSEEPTKGVSNAWLALFLGLFIGVTFTFIFIRQVARMPDDVCKADCSHRGFMMGAFNIEPDRCTCWDRKFEEQDEVEE